MFEENASSAKSETRAQEGANRKDTERSSTQPRRKIVGKDRHSRGHQHSFTDGDDNSREKKLGNGPRQPKADRRSTPDDKADHDQAFAIATIAKARKRKSKG